MLEELELMERKSPSMILFIKGCKCEWISAVVFREQPEIRLRLQGIKSW